MEREEVEMPKISDRPITVGEMLLIQEYSATKDMSAAVRLVGARTGLLTTDIEALDLIEFQRLLGQISQLLTEMIEQQNAIIAAEGLMRFNNTAPDGAA
jgi:hypothetical protein